MKNNPNQNVHDDYTAGSVFKPRAANRLAESIHYDFVVTQEQWDAYLSAHTGATGVNLGDVIASNADGTDNTHFGTVLAPVSIYIAANTSDMPLNLSSRLMSATAAADGPIVDASAYADSGVFKMPVTDGAINLYSAYPYTVEAVVGGINHWSTPQARVLFQDAHVINGVARAGAYATDSNINYQSISDCVIICQRLVGGEGFSISPDAGTLASPDYVPPVIYADWTSGSTYGSLHYYIRAVDTTAPGLYQQVKMSVSLGTEPSLVEGHSTAAYFYSLAKNTNTEVSFVNMELGMVLHVYANGNVSRELILHEDSVVVSDYDVTDIPLLFDASSTLGYYAKSLIKTGTNGYDWARIQVLRNGAFCTITEDCPDYTLGTIEWYSADVGGIDTTFKFKNSRTLDLYRWQSVYSVNDSMWPTSNHHITNSNSEWFDNARNTLPIDADDLAEGIVYTVRIHTMVLPFPEYDDTSNNPHLIESDTPLFRQAVDDSRYKFKLLFVSQNGWLEPAYWGSTTVNTNDASGGTRHVKVTQNTLTSTGTGLPVGQIPPRDTLKEAMLGEVLFVKLDGTVYIMRY